MSASWTALALFQKPLLFCFLSSPPPGPKFAATLPHITRMLSRLMYKSRLGTSIVLEVEALQGRGGVRIILHLIGVCGRHGDPPSGAESSFYGKHGCQQNFRCLCVRVWCCSVLKSLSPWDEIAHAGAQLRCENCARPSNGFVVWWFALALAWVSSWLLLLPNECVWT